MVAIITTIAPAGGAGAGTTRVLVAVGRGVVDGLGDGLADGDVDGEVDGDVDGEPDVDVGEPGFRVWIGPVG